MTITTRRSKISIRALELNSLDAEAYYNRALAYYNVGDSRHAIADFDMVVHLNPQEADAWYNRGLVYMENGFYDDASTRITTGQSS